MNCRRCRKLTKSADEHGEGERPTVPRWRSSPRHPQHNLRCKPSPTVSTSRRPPPPFDPRRFRLETWLEDAVAVRGESAALLSGAAGPERPVPPFPTAQPQWSRSAQVRPTTAVTMVRLEPGSTPASGLARPFFLLPRPVLQGWRPRPRAGSRTLPRGSGASPPWDRLPRRSKGPDCSPSKFNHPLPRHQLGTHLCRDRALKAGSGFCSARTYLLVMGLGPRAADLASGVQQVQWVPRRPKLGFCQGFTSFCNQLTSHPRCSVSPWMFEI